MAVRRKNPLQDERSASLLDLTTDEPGRTDGGGTTVRAVERAVAILRCFTCYSTDVTWVEAAGRGKVHSWTITHHAFVPGFRDELPYVLATVDLEEGVRMNAQLRGADPASLRIGLPVRVDYERAREGLTLPILRAEG